MLLLQPKEQQLNDMVAQLILRNFDAGIRKELTKCVDLNIYCCLNFNRIKYWRIQIQF